MKEEGIEDYNEAYPKRTLLDWPPCEKFPTDEEIESKLNSIQTELLSEDLQEVKY